MSQAKHSSNAKRLHQIESKQPSQTQRKENVLSIVEQTPAAMQRGIKGTHSLNAAKIAHLQRTIGNQTLSHLQNSQLRNMDSAQSYQHVEQISHTNALQIQTFAPDSHRKATIAGLANTFSAEEIGAIYTSNWERDFSQGSKTIADMVLAWKTAKLSAAKNGGTPTAEVAATFREKVWAVIDMNLTEADDESMSGYQSWEHMDAPTAVFTDPQAEAAKRWKGKENQLPGYINDSKAYIKDEITAAVDQYRSVHDKGKIGGNIDNWQGVKKPEGYSPQALDTQAWIGDKNSPSLSRGVIASETADQAKQSGAVSKTQAGWEQTLWQAIGYHLGRGMHATEDFFAHSNWLEVATNLQSNPNQASEPIRTGTFEMPDKAHALGHKLFALASQLLSDFDLLLKLYNAKKASTNLNQMERGNVFTGPNVNDLAFEPLETDSWTPMGEMLDVGIMADNMEELVQDGTLQVQDFLLNKDWLQALKHKGEILIAEGNKEAPATGHGKMAKDQDEHGKDHSHALNLAIVANEMIFAPLRKIMDMADIKVAQEALIKQLALVDQVIAPPSASHPLMKHLKESK